MLQMQPQSARSAPYARFAGGHLLSGLLGMLALLLSTFAANADILTSARMASGMTSRARRPETCTPAG